MKENYDYQQLMVNGDLSEIDPFVEKLVNMEERRQAEKLILIPSESVAPKPVRDALGSVFNNIYAEGYPRDVMREEPEENLQDLTRQITHYRRYANRRFYKGTEFVDMVESLAGTRAKQAFCTEEVSPEEIYVNVQPLSGTAANLAIYDSFVEPGDTVMGMALDQGGHLSHGSEFNLTGKRYDIVSYSVDPDTGKLDYDKIRQLAIQEEPEMIIAGYTSYSWAPDWDKFRSIADEAGAILLADISHVAGMVIAGSYPNPVGKAHVTMTTTHKTIAGPRGAIVLTTNKDRADILDEAIFPGAQGGPHPNKFAAMAVAFQIARTETFRNLQHRVVENARALADSLQENGLTLAYGGTDTHLLVVDLTDLSSEHGFTPMGEVASRILDEARIVTNKNTIPGDESAAEAHGLRLGTPWITQRGMGTEEMEQIGETVADLLKGINYFDYIGLTAPLSRGKVDLGLLSETRNRVAELLEGFPPRPDDRQGYPEFYPSDREDRKSGPQADGPAQQANLPEASLIEVEGGRPGPFLEQLTTREVRDLEVGQGRSSLLLDKNGDLLEKIEVIRADEDGRERYLVIVSAEKAERILSWFRGISDGYVTFDERDYMRKVEGPVKVYDLSAEGVDQGGRAVCGPVETSSLVAALGIDEQTGPARLGSVSIRDGQVHYYRCELNPEVSYLWGPSEKLASFDVFDELEAADYRPEAKSGSLIFGENEKLFDLNRPYFVGQRELEEELDGKDLAENGREKFSFQAKESETERTTTLFEKHEKLGARISEFAGWKMPFWYSTVQEEHRAVREAAGLFDVGHMGVFEVRGKGATQFLDLASSNYVRWLDDREAQYCYFLDPEGRVIDDAMVYRLTETRYLIVVNAANAEKDWQWLKGLNDGQYLLDYDRPWVEPKVKPEVVNLKSPSSGEDRLMNVALQGPRSRKILQELLSDRESKKLDHMLKNQLDTYELNGVETIVARTGYTGEEIGYELLVHPEEAPGLWDDLLEAGESYGIKPAGLGARDSTRIEAGLPLYGHELGGEEEINPTESGFGAYVKFHKPFFVGRDRYKEKALSFQHVENKVVRFKLVEEGGRMVREESPVFDRRGRYLGFVTSCAKLPGGQVGMAYVRKTKSVKEGDRIRIVPALAGKDQLNLKLGSKARMPEAYEAEILPRFPESEGGVPGMKSSE